MSVIRRDTPSGRGFSPGSFQVYSEHEPWTDSFPEDKAMVEVTFPFRSMGFENWETLSFFVPVNEGLYSLSKKIQGVCDVAKSEKAAVLRDLYEKHLDVSGEARIWSPNEESVLPLYANMTPHGRLRVERVRDLFTTPELKKGELRVHVRVWLSIVEKRAHRPFILTPQLPKKTYKREKKNSALQQSGDSTHSPLITTELHQHDGPCGPGKCFKEDGLSVLVREVNGMQIGSIDNAEHSFPWSGYMLAKHTRKQLEGRTEPIPELPSMTFNDHTPVPEHTAGVADYLKDHGQRIHLAIRMVNRLPPQEHDIPPGEEELPANVLMSVKHVPQQEKLICKTLEQSLQKFGKANIHAKFCAALFHEDFEPKWTMHLWVMPQQTGGSSKKLYLFKGGLANFLDITEVEKGNTKLYLEAHVVPREVEEERGLQIVFGEVFELDVGGGEETESERESEDEYARAEGDEIRAQRELEKPKGDLEELFDGMREADGK